MQEREHPGCVVCSRHNPYGLHVLFELLDENSVQGHFDCGKTFEGYDGIIHGGVLSALVDSAMLYCLFAKDTPGVTADLAVQFRHQVSVGSPATVRARLIEQTGPVYYLKAEIIQNEQVKVRATGRFLASTASWSHRKEHGNSCRHNDR